MSDILSRTMAPPTDLITRLRNSLTVCRPVAAVISTVTICPCVLPSADMKLFGGKRVAYVRGAYSVGSHLVRSSQARRANSCCPESRPSERLPPLAASAVLPESDSP